MRFALPLLCLLAVASAGFFDDFAEKFDEIAKKFKGNGKGEAIGRRFGHLNSTQIEEFKKSFDKTNMTALASRLEKRRQKLAKIFGELSPEQKTVMEERMKHWKNKKRSHLNKEGDNLEEVNAKLNLTENFYQGDVILTMDQLDAIAPEDSSEEARVKRMAYKTSRYPNNIWLGQTVYYYFDAGLPAHTQAVFLQAVALWQANTCINFARSATATNRIRVFQGQGCYSYIGKIGGQQDMSLGQGCDSVGTAAHEIGHALGFFHTQSRVDRDSFITLMPANVASGWLDQFNKETAATNYNYGKPYDYGSVMQYGGNSASGNGQPTMVARNALYQDTMGSDVLAFYDLDIMNEHYQCKNKCSGTPVTCQNGGFPNPRACTTTCICPSGYSGATCNVRPAGCGGEVTATTTYQTLNGIAGDNTTVIRDMFAQCHYRIKAPAGRKVQMQITKYYGVYCGSGCVYGGVEIKAQADQKYTGYRFCCNEDVGTTITSEVSTVPIIVSNRYYRNTVSIQYRYV